jgi:DNA-binding beta-propeller fold protein YncE
MSAFARTTAIAVSTVAAPGLGAPDGLFVRDDGTCLACADHSLRVFTTSGPQQLLVSTLAGRVGESGNLDGSGTDARFNIPTGITVNPAGQMVVADYFNHAVRLVSEDGAVSTLAGGGGAGFADGQGAAARFKEPLSVAVTAKGDIVVADAGNHAVRVVTAGGAVRTLAGSGEPGFQDGQGADARFRYPMGLALDADGSVLVVDMYNHAVRRVTMAGAVSTVAGNGEKGYADGEGATARFNQPADVVVDGHGTIVVADRDNHLLRKIVGRQVTTLAGGSEAGAADGWQQAIDNTGKAYYVNHDTKEWSWEAPKLEDDPKAASARFNEPFRLALDQGGRLLVAEAGRADKLRVVEASLAPRRRRSTASCSRCVVM